MNTTEQALKPCPFCGGKAEILSTLQGSHRWFVQCYYGNPACHAQTQLYTSNLEAEYAWNRRVECGPKTVATTRPISFAEELALGRKIDKWMESNRVKKCGNGFLAGLMNFGYCVQGSGIYASQGIAASTSSTKEKK